MVCRIVILFISILNLYGPAQAGVNVNKRHQVRSPHMAPGATVRNPSKDKTDDCYVQCLQSSERHCRSQCEEKKKSQK